jgi:hypothetical protein
MTNPERDPFLPGLKADIAEGLADIAAGRVVSWHEVRAELEALIATLPEYDDDEE